MSALGQFKKYTGDLPEALALGLGGVGAQVAWGFLAPFIPAAVSSLHPAVKPALELAAGVAVFGWATAGGRKKWLRNAGLGAAAGLATGGVLGLAQSFGVLPSAAANAAVSGAVGGFLNGAPVEVTEVAGFAGAPVSIEEVSGLGSAIGATLY